MKAPDQDQVEYPDEGLQALADAPPPWPQVPGGFWTYGERFRLAAPEDRAAVFAEAETVLSPDLQEWDWFLRGVREGYPDFPVPSRWDDWDLGKAMAKVLLG